MNRLSGQRQLIKNVAIAASGPAGAQLLTIAVSPILTRLYGPEAFGYLGSFTAIANILAPLAALTYPLAIVLAKDETEASQVTKLSAVASLAIAFAILAAVLIAHALPPNWSAINSLGLYTAALPLAALISAWISIGQQVAIRNEKFSQVSTSAISGSLASNTLKVLIGTVSPNAMLLIAITIFGQFIQACHIFWSTGTKSYLKVRDSIFIEAKAIIAIAKKYSDFPTYRASQTLISSASMSLPIIFLTATYGIKAAGYYALAFSVTSMPSNLLGKAVADVFYPNITKRIVNGEDVSRALIRSTLILLSIGFIPYGALVAAGPILFSTIFGDAWYIAGEYAAALSILFLMNFSNKPAIAAVPALGIQKGLLVYEVLSTLTKLLALIFSARFGLTDSQAIFAYSVLGAASYLLMIGWIMLISKKSYQARKEK